MQIFLRFVPVILTLSCFLPLLFRWQLPLYIFAILLAHCLILIKIFRERAGLKHPLSLILCILVAYFYYANFVGIDKRDIGEDSLSISLEKESADIMIASKDLKFSLDSKSVSQLGTPIYTLNQTFGKIALGEFKNVEGKTFSVAILETDDLFSEKGWSANRILMRRLTSILRQREQPIVVVFNSSVPAGSSLVKLFMFQARLESIASLSPWKSLVGIKAPLLLGRGVGFSRSEDELGFKFYFKDD